jgi:hypothetical protein
MTAAAELPDDRRAHVAKYAKGALIAAGALGQIPTPLDAVGATLDLHPPEDLFNLADAPPGLMARIGALRNKVRGAVAIGERTVLIDKSQALPQQRFTHGHEIGHRGLPWHEDAYFADDTSTLDPDTHDELEAEASAYSAELLFNLHTFAEQAHSSQLGLAPAIDLAETYEASRRAAIRRYVEDGPRPCALLVLGRYLVHPAGKRALKVLTAIESATFRDRFGPAISIFPTTVPVDGVSLGSVAYAALLDRLEGPIGTGEFTVLDSRKGSVNLSFEVYSNTYVVFALLFAKPRFTLRQAVRAEWTEPKA